MRLDLEHMYLELDSLIRAVVYLTGWAKDGRRTAVLDTGRWLRRAGDLKLAVPGQTNRQFSGIQ